MKPTSTGTGTVAVAVLALAMATPILMLTFLGAGSVSLTQPCAPGDTEASEVRQYEGLWDIDGPTGEPVTGTLALATANIPHRSGTTGFHSSMARVLATHPDLVTLNEVGGRSLTQIKAAAPGYGAYRHPRRDPGPGGSQSINNTVLWRTDTWMLRTAGRVKIVDDDRAYYAGRPVVWDRYATWALLQRKHDDAVVSVIATHQMTNPARFPRQHGNPPLSRRQQYGRGMDVLLALVRALSVHGPVLVGGDMNTHADYLNRGWSAAAKMDAAGYRWYHHGVDFVFYPHHQGVRLVLGRTGPMASDHQWVTARLAMNGAGPTGTNVTTTSGTPAADTVPTSDARDRLMRLRLAEGLPKLTVEQADNAIRIAQVARDLNVTRYGLQIAIAVAIQESRLINLRHGDRDSLGLFQQRPSTGWGTPSQITTPDLAARAFFGRADHTANTGLLDIPGWQEMPLTQAAQAVQRSGFPDAYAQWQQTSADITDLLGDDLPTPAASETGGNCEQATLPAQGCATEEPRYSLGPVRPQLTRTVNILGPMFDIAVVGGYREQAADPNGHPAGLAADFMIPPSAAGRRQGDALAAYAREHATELGIGYLIWRQRIWSQARAEEGWRRMQDRGSETLNHRDHIHLQVLPGNENEAGAACEEVVYPVPESYVGADAHNWHDTGAHWDSWHTGTDFAAPCGTPVNAAHAGTIQIDTSQGWAGPQLVKVTTGPRSLTTWYAHLQQVTVSPGEAVRPGQPIGEVGDLGNSEGCHLHFEVHLNNGPIYGPDNVDPTRWLAAHARNPAAR